MHPSNKMASTPSKGYVVGGSEVASVWCPWSDQTIRLRILSAHNIKHTTVLVRTVVRTARVNQQSPMHQLAVLSTGWATFFHSVPDGVQHNPLPFTADHYIYIIFGLFFIALFLNLTSHIATLITSYSIDLATLLFNNPIYTTTLLT